MGLPRPSVPETATGSGGLSPTSIYADARLAGFTQQDAITATAIALSESSGNANAHNGNAATGDDSWGLWQINLIGKLRSRLQKWGLASPQDLTDPMTNAQAAFSIYKDAGGTFRDWTTYTSGAYTKHLAEAQSAARIVGDSPSTYAVKGKGLAVVGNAVGGAVSDAAGAVTGAVQAGVTSALSAIGPMATKGAFIALGVALVGVGVVKATGAGKAIAKAVP